jgi:hypothetical protein
MIGSCQKQLKRTEDPISSQAWARIQWECIWLVSQLKPQGKDNWPGCADIHKSITSFAGLNNTIKLIPEVAACEPGVNRLIELGWKIDTCEHEDGCFLTAFRNTAMPQHF